MFTPLHETILPQQMDLQAQITITLGHSPGTAAMDFFNFLAKLLVFVA
nr:hypothetical protein [Escherichia coli]